MKRILVAYDGSEPSLGALEQGASLARAFDAELAVVSVTPWRGDRIPAEPWPDATARAAALSAAGDWLSEQGLTAELLSPPGDPARTIELMAEGRAFDTIVVGSRRLGGIARLLLGSVSAHVATNATATVVVARPKPKWRRPRASVAIAPERLTVSTDLQDNAAPVDDRAELHERQDRDHIGTDWNSERPAHGIKTRTPRD